MIESDVTVISPSKYSVNRYLRRRNYGVRNGVEGAVPFALEDMDEALTTPKIIHVLFKRGENWELNYLDRANLMFDNELCQDV